MEISLEVFSIEPLAISLATTDHTSHGCVRPYRIPEDFQGDVPSPIHFMIKFSQCSRGMGETQADHFRRRLCPSWVSIFYSGAASALNWASMVAGQVGKHSSNGHQVLVHE